MTSMKEVVQRLIPLVPEILLRGNEFDTTRFIERVKGPVTLIHGTEDNLVPFSMGQKLKGLLGDKARFVPIDGATHNDLFFRGGSAIEAEIQLLVTALPSERGRASDSRPSPLPESASRPTRSGPE